MTSTMLTSVGIKPSAVGMLAYFRDMIGKDDAIALAENAYVGTASTLEALASELIQPITLRHLPGAMSDNAIEALRVTIHMAHKSNSMSPIVVAYAAYLYIYICIANKADVNFDGPAEGILCLNEYVIKHDSCAMHPTLEFIEWIRANDSESFESTSESICSMGQAILLGQVVAKLLNLAQEANWQESDEVPLGLWMRHTRDTLLATAESIRRVVDA